MAAYSLSFCFRNSSCAAAAPRRLLSPCLSLRDGAQADGNVTSQSSVVESPAFALDTPVVLPFAPPLNPAGGWAPYVKGVHLCGCKNDLEIRPPLEVGHRAPQKLMRPHFWTFRGELNSEMASHQFLEHRITEFTWIHRPYAHGHACMCVSRGPSGASTGHGAIRRVLHV